MVEETQSAFTAHYKTGEHVRFPVAHGDGNYFADDETLDRLEGEGRVAFRYVDERQSQRLGAQHRRHPQREAQRARPDAASRTRLRSAARLHRRPPLFESLVEALA